VGGFIALGAHPTHVQQANSALARLFTGGKRVGNLDLFFAVIWKLVTHSKVEYLKEVSAAADAHMRYRCRHSPTYAGLSGLATYDSTRVPLLVALWYCVASARMAIPPGNNPSRNHIAYSHTILELLKLNGVEMTPSTIKELDKVRCLLKILGYAKNKRYYLELLTKALLFRGSKFDLEARQNMAAPHWRKYVAYFTEDPPKESTISKVMKLYKVDNLTL
jgi:hypothetical protein